MSLILIAADLVAMAVLIFGMFVPRHQRRDLIVAYEQDVDNALRHLSTQSHDIAVELLSLPDQIRGYGPVKEKAIDAVRPRHAKLTKDLASPPMASPQIAAE